MTFRSYCLMLLLLPGLLGSVLSAQVGRAEGLGLQQAVDAALSGNPVMAAVESGRDAAEAQLSQARAARLPGLQFGETFTNSNNPVFVFGSLLEQGHFGPHNFALDSLNQPGSMSNFRSSLNLRLPVFNRFQVSGRIEQAEIGTKLADAHAELARQQLRFGVIQAYFAVQVTEARKQVADEAVKLTEAEVKRIRDLHEQGTVVASDLLSMEVQLADFRQQQIQAEGDLQTAYAALNTVLAEPLSARPALSVGLSDRAFSLPPEEVLITQALESRPDYEQATLEKELRQQDVRVSRGRYLPDLNVFASFGQSSRDLASGSADFAVGANLTFDVVDFGRGARVRQAVAARRVAEAQARRRGDEIRLEVVRAYRNFVAGQERVKVALGAVNQAEEALRIARDRHGVGLTTVTEVLRAQTALVRARMNLFGARYDYHIGYAQSLLAAGQLDRVDAFTK